jgi:hypothetical protein
MINRSANANAPHRLRTRTAQKRSQIPRKTILKYRRKKLTRNCDPRRYSIITARASRSARTSPPTNVCLVRTPKKKRQHLLRNLLHFREQDLQFEYSLLNRLWRRGVDLVVSFSRPLAKLILVFAVVFCFNLSIVLFSSNLLFHYYI